MIKVKEYRGHIRNWEELCERLDIPLDLTREEREEQILVKAYETWGNEMADHMHGMFAIFIPPAYLKTFFTSLSSEFSPFLSCQPFCLFTFVLKCQPRNRSWFVIFIDSHQCQIRSID